MSGRKEFHDLAPPADAHEVIRGLEIDPGTETVPLEDARGRVLAERVDAGIDVPGFDRASMDGYAVRARDTFGADETDPASLEVVGDIHAGENPDTEVESGTAVEVSTGAVMPPGADAVVKVEETTEDGGAVAVRTALAPGDNVMPAGADIAAGARALGPGTRITPREIGLLSALGLAEVPVRSKPTVGILSTGDELTRPGEQVDHSRGEIYDVNSYTIAASVEEAGGDPVLYPHAGDDYEELERLLRQAAAECDLVLSSGSTSASAVDVIYRVIEATGELRMHGVAVKPGKPMLVGTIDRPAGGEAASDEAGDAADASGAAYVGLPGYPVSALTIFRAFVAPAVRQAAGVPEPRTERVTGTMAVRERYAEGRHRLMPAGLLEDETGETLVYPVDKGSGATTSLVEADGIVEMPADTDYLAEGETVEVQLFSPDVRPPTLLGVGEDDPAMSRLLDRVERPRYLPVGSREGVRRLRDGLPDVAVAAGPVERDVEAEDLGGWTREWGLVVADGNPKDVEGLGDLADRDLRFVNRERVSGLRTALDDALGALADERGTDTGALTEAIAGYELTTKAHESPARKVAAGEADAGLGLRSTAEKLGLEFVPVGTQSVRVLANPGRTEKAGVEALSAALSGVSTVVADLPGFDA